MYIHIYIYIYMYTALSGGSQASNRWGKLSAPARCQYLD